jgi:carbonic anhydrase
MKSWLYFDLKYLINELNPIFRPTYLREDLFAGLTVACIAVPLSLAISIASSVPPGIGLISAIVGGILAALFGGTRLAVTGPAAAMAIIIAQCVETHGYTGLLIIGLICGILQTLSGILSFGRFAKLVPLPVISAFTAGIGFIILVGQLPKALQLPAPAQNNVIDVIYHIGQYITAMNPMAFVLAMLTLLILKVFPKYFPKLPTPLIAVAIPTAIVYFAGLQEIKLVGEIPHFLPPPKTPDFSNIQNWYKLLQSALAVFALASLETLLSSSAVDSMGKGDLHNPNQELIGQGIANTGVALFGGIPVTGVIARSSVNLAAGAKTRRSAIIHSVSILGAIYLCPHLVEVIPIAALAGILFSSAISMMNPRELIAFWKADRSEVIVYIITFLMIVATDLIEGVQAGIMVSFLIVTIRMLTTKTNVKLWTNKKVIRINLIGNMTFWSFEKINKIKNYVAMQEQLRVVIFEFDELKGMDTTSAKHMVDVAQKISSDGIKVLFHNVTHTQQNILNMITQKKAPFTYTFTEDQIKRILEKNGVTHTANDMLRHGMAKFLNRYAEDKQQFTDIVLSDNSHPHTLLIMCAESRLNPSKLFSAELGELFVIRNLGNIVPQYTANSNTSESASIIYAIKNLGIRNIVICSHTECNVIKSLIQTAENHSTPMVDSVWFQSLNEELSIQQPKTILDGLRINLVQQIKNLKTYPIINELIRQEQLIISAWIYDIHNAHILEWNETKQQLFPITLNKSYVHAHKI